MSQEKKTQVGGCVRACSMLLMVMAAATALAHALPENQKNKKEPFIGVAGGYMYVSVTTITAEGQTDLGSGTILYDKSGLVFTRDGVKKGTVDAVAAKWEDVLEVTLDEEASKKRGLPEVVLKLPEATWRMVLGANRYFRQMLPSGTDVKADEFFLLAMVTFWHERRDQAKQLGPGTGAAAPPAVTKGMSVQEVVRLLGDPLKKIEVGSSRVMYGYPGQIVTFEDGKVSSIEQVIKE